MSQNPKPEASSLIDFLVSLVCMVIYVAICIGLAAIVVGGLSYL